MSRTIYLLRHGQTVFNAEKRLQGHCDSPLTEQGEAQALAMGATLRALLDCPEEWAVYVSPLGRAQQTARLVCRQLGLPAECIRTDRRLMELGLGEWETRRIPELLEICPALAAGEPDWYTRAPGAESFAGIAGRLDEWLRDNSVPQRVIVVAHGLSGAVMRGIYAGMEYAALWRQDLPQDAFFRLQDGRIARIACAAGQPA